MIATYPAVLDTFRAAVNARTETRVPRRRTYCGSVRFTPRQVPKLGLAIVGLVVVVVILSLGLLVTSPMVPAVSTAHFAVATYVPPIPHGVSLGQPVSSGDPGIMGWSTAVIGRLGVCGPRHDVRNWVALAHGSQVVAGEFVNPRGGGFSFHFEWPDKAVNGGGPASYVLVSSTGVRQQVTLGVDQTTTVVLPANC